MLDRCIISHKSSSSNHFQEWKTFGFHITFYWFTFIPLVKKKLCLPRTHCALHNYITTFTRDVFLSQIHIEMSVALDEATRKLDLWKSFNPVDSNLNIKAAHPLLQVNIPSPSPPPTQFDRSCWFQLISNLFLRALS